MKQSTPIIIGVLAAIIGSIVGVTVTGRNSAVGGKSTLNALVSEINAKLPMQVDRNTRWDSTAALPPNTLVYFYTIVGIEDAKIDKDTLKNHLLPTLLETYRTNPDMGTLRAFKADLKYSYRSSSGAHLFDLNVPFSALGL